jgi:hypothetical protein
MDRSFSRIAALVCSASAIALLAGCASAAPGAAVLGVPKSATSTAPPPSGDVLAGLEQAITNELNAVNATQSANEAPESLIELEALNNPASLLKAENFERLQALGADAAKKRELVVQALIAEVQGDSYLAKVTVGGRNLSEWMVSILNGVNSQLGALTSSLSSVELTDQVRADIISINASTRVYGLIEPMMHLALAGGDELYELATLQNREVSLAKLLSRTGSADPLYTNDQNMIADMKNNLGSAAQKIDAALSAVLGLSASGFPGNRSTIVSARGQLTQVRTPLGTAQGDVQQLMIDLGLAS